jgi:hypothetical protein
MLYSWIPSCMREKEFQINGQWLYQESKCFTRKYLDKAGGVAEAVEHLLSKCEALSTNPSNHSPPKKKPHKKL